MDTLCINCGENLKGCNNVEDSDLLRALKDASRTENHYHAYNLHDLVTEEDLKMPLCALCCISALSVMNRELCELENENLIYECTLNDLLQDSQCNPYQSDLVQDELKKLTLQEKLLEKELMTLAYEEEELAVEIDRQKQMKEDLIETAEGLNRNVKKGKRKFLEHLEKLHYFDSAIRYHQNSLKLLKCDSLTRKLIDKLPDPVYLDKIDDDELD